MAPNSATILFVDDDSTNRQTLSWLLQDAGYRVIEVGTGHEALQRAQERPDLILLDVNLPDLDGFEVCRRLRENNATRHVAVVQMSAVYVESGDRSQGLEQGADAYLVKPVEPRELLAQVSALLRVRAAEEASRRAAQDWRVTFDAIGDALFLLDANGRIQRCNVAASQLVRLPFTDLIGQPLDELLQSALRLEGSPNLSRLFHELKRESAQLSLGSRWYRVTTDPILDENRQLASRVLILHDVTARVHLEEQLRQSQRLEAVGRLAGGVAHDFNNLLTAILGNSSLLLSALPPDEAEHELVKVIERSAWRAAELTRQLLGFSRQSLLWPRQLDVNALLDEVVQSILPTMPETVQLVVHRGENLWPIQADASHISMVLSHLCNNALEAMSDEGGRLTLTSENEEITDSPDHVDARAGAFVRISVEDTGMGIAPELLDKVFDPFFTTKPTGKGKGLGLAMVYGIVRQHHGWVNCKSEVGKGTRFEIYLPRLSSELTIQKATAS